MDKKFVQVQNTTREKVYCFLIKYIQESGYPPSIREICDGTCLSSTASVYRHLQALEDEGRVELKKNSPRAIKVVGFQFVKMEGNYYVYRDDG